MATKNMVGEGIRWSIGNGESEQIQNDKRVPNPNTYKTMTPINPLMYNEKVTTLIDKERVIWKTELVKSIFLPYDAATILAIPLSSASPKDQKIWSATANGVFSVRSAYWVSHKQLTIRDVSLKKEIRIPFGAPLFLGKWYEVTTYFSLYKNIRKKY